MKPYYEHNGVAIYHGDCREILPQLEAESVDLVLTDPPYGISGQQAKEFIELGGRRNFRQQFGQWDMEWDPRPLLLEAHRLLRPGGSLLAFLAAAWIPAYTDTPLIEKKLGVWAKTNPPPRVRPGYQHATEFWIWQAKNGATPTWNGGFLQPNLIMLPLCGGNERQDHPTQKPLLLIKGFVQRHSNPGDLILDPYLGTGTTVRAAKDLGRRAIGIEIEEKYCEIAVRRLAQEVLV